MSKLVSVEEIVGSVESGMTLGIGGWGSRRKPMALVEALCKTDVRDLTVVSYGGPDVGMLCAAGKVKRVVAPFVTLDSIALEPHFRKARQTGAIEFTEYDEGMFMFGLYAAAHRLPFLPTPVGIGSDVLKYAPQLKTITDPYGDEELVAVPALKLDVAFVHMNRADARGNGQYLGMDPYMDDLFAKAATRAYVSCEQLVERFEGHPSTLLISRMHTAGVVEVPGGAGFTECLPDYPRDEARQKSYVEEAGK